MVEIASQLDENIEMFLKLNSVKETIQRSIIEAKAQINELQQKVDSSLWLKD